MEKLLLTIIIASGPCAVSSHVKHRYHFVYDLKNFTDAQSYCREKYSDLATIDGMEDVEILNNMAELNKMVYSAYSYRAWIGLYDVGSWRWSLSDSSFYKDGETEFRKWYNGEPDNYYGKKHCIVFHYGHWHNFPCEADSYVGVCMDVTGTNVTFVLTSSTMTWPEAQSYCRANHTDLASVRNEEDNEEIRNLLDDGHYGWIGLYRDSSKWSDGSNQPFRYWAPGEPTNIAENETCVAADFNNSGKWEDWDCNVQRAFICYSVVPVSRQVMKVKLKMKNSPVDPNDPIMIENMLKKLKQTLKDQGLNENVKLSWRRQSDGKVFHKEKKKRKSDSCRKTEL